ncbi:MAG: hypothetical protein IJQ49_04245 [Prevotella sp.]|nr:hypothetical protein [Prevotella sp.]
MKVKLWKNKESHGVTPSPYGLNGALLPAVGLTLPCCRPEIWEQSGG